MGQPVGNNTVEIPLTFYRGVEGSTAVTQIPDGFCEEMENADISTKGITKCRKGYKRIVSKPYPKGYPDQLSSYILERRISDITIPTTQIAIDRASYDQYLLSTFGNISDADLADLAARSSIFVSDTVFPETKININGADYSYGIFTKVSPYAGVATAPTGYSGSLNFTQYPNSIEINGYTGFSFSDLATGSSVGDILITRDRIIDFELPTYLVDDSHKIGYTLNTDYPITETTFVVHRTVSGASHLPTFGLAGHALAFSSGGTDRDMLSSYNDPVQGICSYVNPVGEEILAFCRSGCLYTATAVPSTKVYLPQVSVGSIDMPLTRTGGSFTVTGDLGKWVGVGDSVLIPTALTPSVTYETLTVSAISITGTQAPYSFAVSLTGGTSNAIVAKASGTIHYVKNGGRKAAVTRTSGTSGTITLLDSPVFFDRDTGKQYCLQAEGSGSVYDNTGLDSRKAYYSTACTGYRTPYTNVGGSYEYIASQFQPPFYTYTPGTNILYPDEPIAMVGYSAGAYSATQQVGLFRDNLNLSLLSRPKIRGSRSIPGSISSFQSPRGDNGELSTLKVEIQCTYRIRDGFGRVIESEPSDRASGILYINPSKTSSKYSELLEVSISPPNTDLLKQANVQMVVYLRVIDEDGGDLGFIQYLTLPIDYYTRDTIIIGETPTSAILNNPKLYAEIVDSNISAPRAKYLTSQGGRLVAAAVKTPAYTTYTSPTLFDPVTGKFAGIEYTDDFITVPFGYTDISGVNKVPRVPADLGITFPPTGYSFKTYAVDWKSSAVSVSGVRFVGDDQSIYTYLDALFDIGDTITFRQGGSTDITQLPFNFIGGLFKVISAVTGASPYSKLQALSGIWDDANITAFNQSAPASGTSGSSSALENAGLVAFRSTPTDYIDPSVFASSTTPATMSLGASGVLQLVAPTGVSFAPTGTAVTFLGLGNMGTLQFAEDPKIQNFDSDLTFNVSQAATSPAGYNTFILDPVTLNSSGVATPVGKPLTILSNVATAFADLIQTGLRWAVKENLRIPRGFQTPTYRMRMYNANILSFPRGVGSRFVVEVIGASESQVPAGSMLKTSASYEYLSAGTDGIGAYIEVRAYGNPVDLTLSEAYVVDVGSLFSIPTGLYVRIDPDGDVTNKTYQNGYLVIHGEGDENISVCGSGDGKGFPVYTELVANGSSYNRVKWGYTKNYNVDYNILKTVTGVRHSYMICANRPIIPVPAALSTSYLQDLAGKLFSANPVPGSKFTSYAKRLARLDQFTCEAIPELGITPEAGDAIKYNPNTIDVDGETPPVLYPNRIQWTNRIEATQQNTTQIPMFKSKNIYDINSGDDSGITGLAALQNVLIIAKRDSLYRATFNDDESVTVQRIQSPVGALGMYNMPATPDKCYFVNETGVYCTDGNTVENIFTLSRRWDTNVIVSKTLFELAGGYIDNIKKEVHLGIPYVSRFSNSSYPVDSQFVYSYNDGVLGWTVNTNIPARCWARFNGKNVFGSADGNIYEMCDENTPDAYYDNGMPIVRAIRTKFVSSMGDQFGQQVASPTFKFLRNAIFQFGYDSNYDTEVYYSTNWNNTEYPLQLFKIRAGITANGIQYFSNSKFLKTLRETLGMRVAQIAFTIVSTVRGATAPLYGVVLEGFKTNSKLIDQKNTPGNTRT